MGVCGTGLQSRKTSEKAGGNTRNKGPWQGGLGSVGKTIGSQGLSREGRQ